MIRRRPPLRRQRACVLPVAAILLLVVALPSEAASKRIEESRKLAAERSEFRILLGEPVPLADRPWQVALVRSEDPNDFYALFCGGTLVAPGWVLTANHCVDGGTLPEEVEVLFGSDHLDGSGDRIAVRRIVQHLPWDSADGVGDLALLALAGEIRSQPVAVLASADELAAADLLEVSGWGKFAEFFGLRSEFLRRAELPLVPLADCRRPDSYGARVTDEMFCAGQVSGGPDSCDGDSGGPATVTGADGPRLAGVVSWGEGCGKAKKYGVYTRLPLYRQWIEDSLAGG